MLAPKFARTKLQHFNADDLLEIYNYIEQSEQDKPETGKSRQMDSSSAIMSEAAAPAQGWDRPEEREDWAYLWLGR